MVSFFARRLLQTAAGLRFSSPCARYRPVLTYFSATSSSAPSSLARSSSIQSLNNRPEFLSLRFASSKAGSDENLLKVLQSEIDCVQEFKDPRDLEVPEGFPFEIIDNPGDQTITLKREFAGENIQALVYMNLDGEEDGGENDKDDDDDDEQENSIQPSISLHVTIDKGDVPILEFGCNLNSDELEIESMARKSQEDSDGQGAYEGPNFSDLDESLQKAFHKYLEVRGITGSLHGFLHEYMTNKDEREYLTWLKNIEVFVRKQI